MKNKIPPPILLVLTGAIMWLLARSAIGIPVAITYALIPSLCLGAAGVLIDMLALRQFSASRTTVNPRKPESATELIRSGVYSRSRNPMYVGLVFILAGWGVWLGSVTNLLVIVLFVLLITQLQIKPEESALRKLFGEAYMDYCERVRRWL